MDFLQNGYSVKQELHNMQNNKHINNLIKNSPTKMSDHEICKKYNQKTDRRLGDTSPKDTILMTHDDALKHYTNKSINNLMNYRITYSKQKASLGRKIDNDKIALNVDGIGKSLGAQTAFNDKNIKKSLQREQKQLKADKAEYLVHKGLNKDTLDIAKGIHRSHNRFISVDSSGIVSPATAKQLKLVVPHSRAIHRSQSKHVNQTSATQHHSVQESVFDEYKPNHNKAIKRAKIQRAQGMQR